MAYAKLTIMKARLFDRRKETLGNGAIVIWVLPSPTLERPLGLIYSLFYGRPDERIIGYDNERAKTITGITADAKRRTRLSIFKRFLRTSIGISPGS